ncbi:CBS domain-containing protein [Dactylosporangium sp. AC04546]|uniref:CBS domain-containing protein n=1 Tax=Dactylosporangium sp. AC04546 TaxID=2862460 RepID=UPI001EE153D7|nr:CBS domain-containing protein [Dactylosporangium sp. AC04546]WVK78541.1 CBS domain-containing protein [Dactylosporangium sp. AC04546]
MSRWNVADVMTIGAVSVQADTPFKEIVDLLEAHEVNAVPVIDRFDRVVGVVSSADLTPKIEFAGDDERFRLFESRQTRQARGKAHATAAGELMNAPAVTVMSTTSLAAAARIMDSAQLKRLPVVDALGRLIGMVTRRDLLKVFLRSDAEIRREILAEAVDGLVGVDAASLRVEVDDGVVTLLGEVESASVVPSLVRQVERVDGVVDVVSHLSAVVDDTDDAQPGFRSPVMF